MNTKDWISRHRHLSMFAAVTVVALIGTGMFQIMAIIENKHEALNLKLFCYLDVPKNDAEREAMRPQMVACVNTATEQLLQWEQVELDLLRSGPASIYDLRNGTVTAANNALKELHIVQRLQQKYFPPTPSTTS